MMKVQSQQRCSGGSGWGLEDLAAPVKAETTSVSRKGLQFPGWISEQDSHGVELQVSKRSQEMTQTRDITANTNRHKRQKWPVGLAKAFLLPHSPRNSIPNKFRCLLEENQYVGGNIKDCTVLLLDINECLKKHTYIKWWWGCWWSLCSCVYAFNK